MGGGWSPLKRTWREAVRALAQGNYPSNWGKWSHPYFHLCVQLGMTHHLHYSGVRPSSECGWLFTGYCDLMLLPSESMASPMSLITLHSIAMEIIVMITHGALWPPHWVGWMEDEWGGKKVLVYCTQMTWIISLSGQEKWPESGLRHKLLSLEVYTMWISPYKRSQEPFRALWKWSQSRWRGGKWGAQNLRETANRCPSHSESLYIVWNPQEGLWVLCRMEIPGNRIHFLIYHFYV